MCSTMMYNIRDIIEYIIALVNEFAKRFGLTEKQAYRYIRMHQGISYKKTVAQQMESAVRNAVLKKDDEIRNLKDRLSWRDKILRIFTKILMQSNDTFRKAVDSIISFAKDTYRSILSREESKTIKSVMEAFGKDKEDYRAIGTFLVFTADEKESLSNSEYRKASREVSDIAIGRYELTQKRGYSMKM